MMGDYNNYSYSVSMHTANMPILHSSEL